MVVLSGRGYLFGLRGWLPGGGFENNEESQWVGEVG